MLKIRTAKRDFTDSTGRPVKAGETFVLVELRPLFLSRQALEDILKQR